MFPGFLLDPRLAPHNEITLNEPGWKPQLAALGPNANLSARETAQRHEFDIKIQRRDGNKINHIWHAASKLVPTASVVVTLTCPPTPVNLSLRCFCWLLELSWCTRQGKVLKLVHLSGYQAMFYGWCTPGFDLLLMLYFSAWSFFIHPKKWGGELLFRI